MPRSSVADPATSGPLQRAADAVRAGGLAVVAEDGPDGIGDLVTASDRLTDATTVFMVIHGGGVLYAILPADRCDALRLEPQNASADPRFWVSDLRTPVDAAAGIRTGISAADRARTLHVLADGAATAADLVRPGHIVPFAARPAGTLERPELGEAALDLVRLAGAEPCATEAEILNPDGSRARGKDLQRFADHHGLPLVAIADIVAHRRALAGPPVDGRHVDYQTFRSFFGAVPAPVSIVATAVDGRPHATTVSAFCSLSAEPALLLVALSRSSDLLDRIRSSGRFGLSVLGIGQEHLALRCAAKGEEKIPADAWEAGTSDPKVRGASAWSACRVERIVDGGDHEIVIGRVTECHLGARPPLVHRERTFHELVAVRPER
jgi:3,4-dihydroxy-2-butanone 4-phosphate synthase